MNDTGDFYRFFDATPPAELLYACVQHTIEHDLPAETAFLRRYDSFRQHVEAFIEMPERMIDLLFRFLNQNGGQLSERAREKEFQRLTDEEAQRIESILTQQRKLCQSGIFSHCFKKRGIVNSVRYIFFDIGVRRTANGLLLQQLWFQGFVNHNCWLH